MNNIKQLRRQARLSQLELAQLCGVHQTAISQWENGKTNPDMETLMLLSGIFNASIDTILGLDVPNAATLVPLKAYLEDDSIEFVDESDICEYIPYIPEYGKKEDYFGLKISDNSLSPTFIEGDTLIIRTNCEISDNDIALVGNKERSFLSRVKIFTDGIFFMGEKPEDDVIYFANDKLKKSHVNITGRVVQLIREL